MPIQSCTAQAARRASRPSLFVPTPLTQHRIAQHRITQRRTTQRRITKHTPAHCRSCQRNPQMLASMPIPLRALSLAAALSVTLTNPIPTPASQPPAMTTTTATLAPPPNRTHHEPRAAGLASRLRARGIPDPVSVLVVSSLPILELRGGIPLGYYLQLPPGQTLLLAIIGNLLPLPPTLLLLRLRATRTLFHAFLARARKAADKIGNARSRALALSLFVAVPLPGTGAWTGCLIAFLLDMPFVVAFPALALGVVVAAVFVSVLCLLGYKGGVVAAVLLAIAAAVSFWRAREPRQTHRER